MESSDTTPTMLQDLINELPDSTLNQDGKTWSFIREYKKQAHEAKQTLIVVYFPKPPTRHRQQQFR